MSEQVTDPGEWKLIRTTYNDMEAEVVSGRLASQGIRVLRKEESAGKAIGINIGPLGQIDLFVQAEDFDAALAMLDEELSEDTESDI